MLYYENLLGKLLEKQVRFLVIGGLAVNLHGVPRMTADIDIAVEFSPTNVDRLLEALRELGYTPAVPVHPEALANREQREEWRTTRNMQAFSFLNAENPLAELDVLLEFPDFEVAWERRFEVPVGSLKIPVASIDDLIRTKRGTGRKQDESDIVALELAKRLVSEKESE